MRTTCTWTHCLSLFLLWQFGPCLFNCDNFDDHVGHEEEWKVKDFWDFGEQAYNWSDVYKKRLYIVVPEPKMTWAQAIYACATHLLELVELETPEELAFVDNMIKRIHFDNDVNKWWDTNTSYWVGGNKHSPKYTIYYWFSSGKTVQPPFWQYEQPPTMQKAYSCAVVKNQPNRHNFSVSARQCQETHGYICKSKCVV